MLKLISGKKGSGKTKQLISMVNSATETSSGKIVCIERGSKLKFDVNHDARLLNTEDYNVSSYDAFYGFLAGIVASDYDVKEIYVDSIAKIIGNDEGKISDFLSKVEKIADDGIDITIMISGDKKELPESIAKSVTLNLV